MFPRDDLHAILDYQRKGKIEMGRIQQNVSDIRQNSRESQI